MAINILNSMIINRISAGEVVESPFSVVKELVDNSLDAGATKISVEIKNGGIDQIIVKDNGKGIEQEDLVKAFLPHATSKISSVEDLESISTLGFRGEALASISAISNVELVSKTQEQDIGYRIVVEAGDVLEKEETGCQKGTSITVRNLFFNTPVRYKFLKKDYTEAGYIEDVITRIALVNPDISIKLINSGKTVIQTNGDGNIKNVIYNIYGKDVANGIMDTTYQYEDINITGVIGKPEIARSNRSNQLFFVNKRYIKDKTLTAATEQAYKGLIPIGKFGFVILNIEINPSKVDVNVHPAKLEVRFQEESKVFQAIYHAIKDTLLKTELIANVEQETSTIERTAQSFEDRLKNIRESKQQGGLFSFRKQKEKQIEQYTDEESKIKTNVTENINNSSENIEDNEQRENSVKIANGNPIDTSDILAQLKQMKEKITNELATKNDNIELLTEKSEEYKLEKNEEIENDEKSDKESLGEEEIIKEENNEVESDIKQETNTEEINNIEEQNNEKTYDVNQNMQISEEDENTENLVNNSKTETNEDEKLQQKDEEEKTKLPDVNAAIEDIEDPDIQKEFEEIKKKMQNLNDNPQVVSDNFNEMYAKMFGTMPIQDDVEKTKDSQETNAVDIINDNISVFEEEKIDKPSYKFIGIAFKTYIILEIEKELYILDQHAAHERIMYEKVKKNYYSDTSKDSQMLLLPDVITLTHKEMDIAKENMKMFEQAGFSLEEFGENTIKLTGVPTVCIDLDNKELFLETLDEINTVARTAKQEKEEKFIATVACKAAVKANMALTKEEVESLLDKLLQLPNPFTCPHGRPTAIKMTKYDIERKFARK